MKGTTQRAILRWIHLIFAIPIIGYVYSPFAELPSYAPIVRYIAFPIILLSGFWMYGGAVFAIIAVALWLGACQLFGYGTALLMIVVLLIARKIWSLVRARQSKEPA